MLEMIFALLDANYVPGTGHTPWETRTRCEHSHKMVDGARKGAGKPKVGFIFLKPSVLSAEASTRRTLLVYFEEHRDTDTF